MVEVFVIVYESPRKYQGRMNAGPDRLACAHTQPDSCAERTQRCRMVMTAVHFSSTGSCLVTLVDSHVGMQVCTMQPARLLTPLHTQV